jgi:hypothetical protein
MMIIIIFFRRVKPLSGSFSQLAGLRYRNFIQDKDLRSLRRTRYSPSGGRRLPPRLMIGGSGCPTWLAAGRPQPVSSCPCQPTSCGAPSAALSSSASNVVRYSGHRSAKDAPGFGPQASAVRLEVCRRISVGIDASAYDTRDMRRPQGGRRRASWRSAWRPGHHITDPDLAVLVATWPKLPEHVRATIRTLLEAVLAQVPFRK